MNLLILLACLVVVHDHDIDTIPVELVHPGPVGLHPSPPPRAARGNPQKTAIDAWKSLIISGGLRLAAVSGRHLEGVGKDGR